MFTTELALSTPHSVHSKLGYLLPLFSVEPEAVLLLFGSVRAAAPTLMLALLLTVLLGLFALLIGLGNEHNNKLKQKQHTY